MAGSADHVSSPFRGCRCLCNRARALEAGISMRIASIDGAARGCGGVGMG